ncbi:MAG: Com family DNA-binding transcriptional regulator [Cycloclasticus sp.]
MIEVRCNRCSKLLAKALFKQIEIKCTRCKTINFLKANEPTVTIWVN